MIPRFFARAAAPLVRKFGTTAVRRDHDTSGIAGSTLPFSVSNRYFVLLGFILYFGSGLALPFLVLRRNLLKERAA